MRLSFLEIMDMVAEERRRQDEQWGANRSQPDPLWATILGEEYGELCEAILERDEEAMVKEAVQVAAVCFAFLEQRGWRDRP